LKYLLLISFQKTGGAFKGFSIWTADKEGTLLLARGKPFWIETA
jgi:hypothetical protein